MMIYQVTTPATATAPEGLRRVTNNQIVGGKCYVGLEVEISAGGYLSNRLFSLKITEDPDTEHGVTHPGASDHIYFQLAASRPEGASSVSIPGVPAENQPRWQLWNASLEKWQEAPHGPLDHRSAQRERWRVLIPWQTTTATQMPDHGTPYYSTLLGHNGPHTFKVNNIQDSSLLIQNTSTATFACDELQYGAASHSYGMSHSVEIDKATDKANVQNLVISEAKAHDENQEGNPTFNPHYFKFDKDSTDELRAHPKITFSIEDKGAPEGERRYRWWLFIRKTTPQGAHNFATYTGTIEDLANGVASRTITINQDSALGQYTFDNMLNDWGTYAFDLTIAKVNEANVAGDTQHLRSTVISIPNTMPYPIVDESGNSRPGHEIYLWSDVTEAPRWRAAYYLQSERNASAVNIDLLDARLDNIVSPPNLPLTKKQDHVVPDIYTPDGTEAVGTSVGVFMATDQYADFYRGHKPKSMLAVNQRKQKPRARSFAQKVPGTQDGGAIWPDAISWPRFFHKQSQYIPEINIANFSNKQLLTAMPGARLLFTVGHGNDGSGGFIGCTSTAANLQPTRPNDLPLDPTGNTWFISDLPQLLYPNQQTHPAPLGNMRLAVYLNCYSGADSGNGRGNIIDETVNQGSSAAAGFTTGIPIEAMNQYSFYLWESLCQAERTEQHSVWSNTNLPSAPIWNAATRRWTMPGGYSSTTLKRRPETTGPLANGYSPLGLTNALEYAARKFRDAHGNTVDQSGNPLNYDSFRTVPDNEQTLISGWTRKRGFFPF